MIIEVRWIVGRRDLFNMTPFTIDSRDSRVESGKGGWGKRVCNTSAVIVKRSCTLMLNYHQKGRIHGYPSRVRVGRGRF